jgi:hypothetical protein
MTTQKPRKKKSKAASPTLSSCKWQPALDRQAAHWVSTDTGLARAVTRIVLADPEVRLRARRRVPPSGRDFIDAAIAALLDALAQPLDTPDPRAPKPAT